MAEVDKRITEALDNMALKIVLIEPGDLSVVGELLELLEKVLAVDDFAVHHPELCNMVVLTRQALEKIIMAELADSAENFELVGECIALFQEIGRQGKAVSENQVRKFCSLMGKIGVEVDGATITAGTVPMPRMAGAEPAAEKEEAAAEPVAAPPEPPVTPPPRAAASAPATGADEEPAIVQQPEEFLQDLELLGGFIEESSEHLETIEVNVLELENNPDDPEIINNIFRPFHTIKGVSGFLNLKAINKLAHATENLLDDVRNGTHPMDSDVIDIVLGVGDYLRTMINNIREVMEKGPAAHRNFDIRDFTRRIRAVQSGEVLAAADAAPSRAAAPAPQAVRTSTPVAAAPAGEAAPAESEEGGGAKRTATAGGGKLDVSIKVNVEKLDALVNAVGELVIMQSLVQENPHIRKIVDPKLVRDFSQLGRLTSELQKTAMSMRMVPIRQTFQKMIRLVRDLSKKSGKVVDLIMEGEETEIDRNMVDSIYDPLVHMIRNSVDHGVQKPEERERLGKPRAGTVALRAYQKGGNMVIEIEDDGNGLNTEKIRSKAIERGLIQPEDNLSDHDLNNLIFLPGFSTADKITDVSGRGVGMDVVKKAVEKLRGKVEVVSQPGRGSQFIIKLPLTLAIIDGIIVRIGSERYIIPTIAIKESLKPEEKHYQTVYNRGEAILLRDKLVPIIRLYKVFNVEPTCTDPCQTILVVVEHEGQQRALMVDELLGKQEVVIKSLGGLLVDIPGVAGGTILGDGRVGLILDLAGLVDRDGGRPRAGGGDETF
ncbi:MAG: chemotaxis protein CheA [Thermodesulfobacteriota bacterium]